MRLTVLFWLFYEMSESETYKELGALTKCKERWERWGCFESIQAYWLDLFRFVHDEAPGVRLAFIWASENIATNTPDPYQAHMSVFARLLLDSEDKVRMEAPEIFRVLGKRRPEFVAPHLDELRHIAETDTNRVVRIHCQGAIRATR